MTTKTDDNVFPYSDCDFKELLNGNENELFEKIGAELNNEAIADEKYNYIGACLLYPLLLVDIIFFGILLPSTCKSRKKARKIHNICQGKQFYYDNLQQIQAVLCKKNEPRFFVNEITSGEIRNIASMLVSSISVPWAIACYLTVLIVKFGLNNFCKSKIK